MFFVTSAWFWHVGSHFTFIYLKLAHSKFKVTNTIFQFNIYNQYILFCNLPMCIKLIPLTVIPVWYFHQWYQCQVTCFQILQHSCRLQSQLYHLYSHPLLDHSRLPHHEWLMEVLSQLPGHHLDFLVLLQVGLVLNILNFM